MDAHSESSSEAEIRSLLVGWLDALSRKDAEAVIAFGGPGYRNFSLAPPLVDAGGTAADLQSWFDTWDGPLAFESRDRVVVADTTVAFAHSIECMRGTKKDDGPQELWFRRTIGLKKIGGTWKIVHEHDSVPFYMDGSFKAAVDLKP